MQIYTQLKAIMNNNKEPIPNGHLYSLKNEQIKKRKRFIKNARRLSINYKLK